MLRRYHWLPLLLVLVGLTASAYALYRRYSVERENRAVGLVLDYNQFRVLTSAAGVPLDDAFRRFKAADVTGMAVTEETLADLQTAGVLTVREVRTRAGEREYRVAVSDRDVADRLA